MPHTDDCCMQGAGLDFFFGMAGSGRWLKKKSTRVPLALLVFSELALERMARVLTAPIRVVMRCSEAKQTHCFSLIFLQTASAV